VQGWTIVDKGCDWIRLETQSWYMSAQAVFVVGVSEVSVSVSLRFDHAQVARLAWSLVALPHQRAVPIMLRQAGAIVTGASS
jgi:hypothetical protein